MSVLLIVLAAAVAEPEVPLSLCGREAASVADFGAGLDEAVKAGPIVHSYENGLHIYVLDERSEPMPRTRIWMAPPAEDKAHPAIACFDYYYAADGLQMKANFRCDGKAEACAKLAERLMIKKDPS
jgi:hypothetical protein